MLSAAASCSQADLRFLGAGNQCVTNSYQAMVFALKKSPANWLTVDLNAILDKGDKLYSEVGISGHLLITDIPETHENIKMNIISANSGSLYDGKVDKPYISLVQALEDVKDFCFLTIKCYTVSIIKSDNYYVFDPHSRDTDGMPHGDGSAVLTKHKTVNDLIEFLECLGERLSSKSSFVPFEVTIVSLSDILNNSTQCSSSSDFEGFSEISDTEYNSIMNMQTITNHLDSEVSDARLSDLSNVSNVTSSKWSDKEFDSEDELPLATLKRKISEVGNEREDYSYSDSSGSEYEFTAYEKEMIEKGINDSDSEGVVVDDVEMGLNESNNSLIPVEIVSNVVVNDVEMGLNESCNSLIPVEIVSNVVVDDVEMGLYESCNSLIPVEIVSNDVVDDVEMGLNESCNSLIPVEIVSNDVDLSYGSFESWVATDRAIEENCDTLNVSMGSLESWGLNEMNFDMQTNIDERLNSLEPMNVEPILNNESLGSLESWKLQSNDYDTENGLSLGSMESWRLNGDNVDNHKSTTVVELTTSATGEAGACENRGRKRRKNIDEWARTIAKRKKNHGEEFVNHLGKVRHAREMKKGCGQKCRYKCHSKFNENGRKDLFHTFNGLEDINKQRQFLIKYATAKQKAIQKTKGVSKRSNSINWSFPLNGECIRVCKTFFLDTLNISDQMIHTANNKSKLIPGVCETDKRGKHKNRPNRVSGSQVEFIKRHIESFPVTESHYCRKDSKKQYLAPDLSLPKMYHLYLEKAAKDGIKPEKISMYRHIFDNSYNIGFHRPTKDQCDFCKVYNTPQNERANIQEEFEVHHKNLTAARESKTIDKKFAQSSQDPQFAAACFDMQEVLMTPKGFESVLYYKRRLNSYNFSVYDLGTSDAFCYLWNESISGRGANEIASCIYAYIEEMAGKGKTKFVFYSDNCWAQNKNKYYVSMWWYALQKFNLEYIQHKYLEKGHTQNENDSVHAAVENTSRNISVYTTAQWAATIRSSRFRKPYHVNEMDMSSFYNFKEVAGCLKNFTIDVERNKVRWANIRCMQMMQEHPNMLLYQYDYDGPVQYCNLLQRMRRSQFVPDLQNMNLTAISSERPPIKWDKYKDLLTLCQKGIIPRPHHAFYLTLPHDKPAD